jgi:hypothetical protein
VILRAAPPTAQSRSQPPPAVDPLPPQISRPSTRRFRIPAAYAAADIARAATAVTISRWQQPQPLDWPARGWSQPRAGRSSGHYRPLLLPPLPCTTTVIRCGAAGGPHQGAALPQLAPPHSSQILTAALAAGAAAAPADTTPAASQLRGRYYPQSRRLASAP